MCIRSGINKYHFICVICMIEEKMRNSFKNIKENRNFFFFLHKRRGRGRRRYRQRGCLVFPSNQWVYG